MGCGRGWLGGLGCLQAREKESTVADLFLMVEKVTPDKAVEAMSKYGGTVLKTSLSKESEKGLQEALRGGSGA